MGEVPLYVCRKGHRRAATLTRLRSDREREREREREKERERERESESEREKRVCSDRPLCGLSSGAEVPSEPPENWLNQPPAPERFLVNLLMTSGVA